MSSIDFFRTCKICNDEECCKDPYYAFCGRHEIKKIKKFLNDSKKTRKLQNWLESENTTIMGTDYEFFSIKRIDGTCIFLEGERLCQIHPVKPLDCRTWPLTWDYIEEKNRLLIYIGECPLKEPLLRNPGVVESIKRKIISEVQDFTPEERAVYTSFEKNETLETFEEISIDYKKPSTNKKSTK